MEDEDENKEKLINTEPTEWRSCCFVINQNFLKYIVQVFISLMILTLSIYKLIVISENSDEKSVYTGLLTLVLGIYCPTPSIKK